jgi:hypothetical protein
MRFARAHARKDADAAQPRVIDIDAFAGRLFDLHRNDRRMARPDRRAAVEQKRSVAGHRGWGAGSRRGGPGSPAPR